MPRSMPKENAVNQRGSRRRAAPKVVSIGRAKGQPELPDDRVWPEQTHDWWQMWGASPLTNDFLEVDWSELLDTALFHALMWDPSAAITTRMKAGAEVRRRSANFGATPLDRMRLRITVVLADEAEARADGPEQPSARRRRGGWTGGAPDA